MQWEDIGINEKRAKVHGGWIVKMFENVCHKDTLNGSFTNGYDWRIAAVFVPDPNHEWEIS